MAPKRKNLSAIDKLLENAPKITNVEKCLRSEARGLMDEDIKFVKFHEPLNASSLVNMDNVTILEPNKPILKPIINKDLLDCYTEVLMCQIDGDLKLYNNLTNTCSTLFNVKGEHSSIVKGLQIITGLETGELSIWNLLGERISSDKWKCGAHLNTIKLSEKNNTLATGGKGNSLKIWDINTEKVVFSAKNVRPDNLQLQVPINDLNIRFLNDGPCVITSTEKNQIRLYDPRIQRRPIKELEWLDSPIQGLSTCCRENFILAGNNRGELGLFDLRITEKNAKINLASKFKGFLGAIRSIEAHPTKPLFVSCGMDRFVIAHDLNTLQLNNVLLVNENSITKPKEKEIKREIKEEFGSDDEDEEDENEDEEDSEDNSDEDSDDYIGEESD